MVKRRAGGAVRRGGGTGAPLPSECLQLCTNRDYTPSNKTEVKCLQKVRLRKFSFEPLVQ